MEPTFWVGKRVLLTGHTGFKGGWLGLMLERFGARVTGFALPPPTRPSLFEAARVGDGVGSLVADVRDLDAVRAAVVAHRPEVVFHLAAQPIVRVSYADPAGTIATNVMGTVNVLEAVRENPSVRVLVLVTSDKCYENREWLWGYRENEALGGRDPYSASKACAEIVATAYRESYFGSGDPGSRRPVIATVRAGNVIGGGDWARDRIVPDAVRAFAARQVLVVRAPLAVRPWQHVLEPLSGYLTLAERMWSDGQFAGQWNFGPADGDAKPVAWIVEHLAKLWDGDPRWERRPMREPHEARYLRLDCTKARSFLAWNPRLRLGEALAWVVEWYRTFYQGGDVRKLTFEQIDRYLARPLLT